MPKPITIENLGEHLEQINGDVKTLNEKQAAFLKKYDGLDAKTIADITEHLTKAVDFKQQLDRVEAAQQRFGLNGDKDGVKEADAKRKSFLKEWATKGGNASIEDFAEQKGIELKSMSVGTNVDGGYTVMPQFTAVMKTREFETSPLRELASVQTISGDELDYLADSDQATSGGWTGETSSRGATNTPKINKLIIPAHEQYANPQATQKLLDDSSIDIESWLGNKVADIIGRTENTAFISGNGVSRPYGILSYAAWAVNGTYQDYALEQIHSGGAGGLTYNGLVNLQNALKEPYQANATFLMKRATFGLAMQIVDGISRPIFNLSFDKNTGLEMNLLGAPVRFADDMAAAASASLSVAYGDFRRGYQIVDKLGLRILRDPYTNKPFVTFYTTKRTGGAVVNFEAIKLLLLSV